MVSEEMADNYIDSLIKEIERLQTRVNELELQKDCEIGDVVVFALFGKETIGVVTKKVVVIDAGAGELEIDSNNIIQVVDENKDEFKSIREV